MAGSAFVVKENTEADNTGGGVAIGNGEGSGGAEDDMQWT